MFIKTITRVFKGESLSKVKTALGRWNINNHRESMIKNKYATEDNCYISCNNYQFKIKNNRNIVDERNYIFMMGYDSCI